MTIVIVQGCIIKGRSVVSDQIRATEISSILTRHGNGIKTLSLDCFDTLLWRKTAVPRDVFHSMQHRPLFKQHKITAYQRIQAAARAYRLQFLTKGHREISLSDIYKSFTNLSETEREALVEEELLAEMDACYAFPPVLELIRQAKAQGLKVIIVSDIYLTEAQLRRLLTHCLPDDVMQAIDEVFCSCVHERSKSTGLFENVLAKLNLKADEVLHLGDHPIADYESPKKMQIKALHFLQFDNKTSDFLRIQHAAAALNPLSQPNEIMHLIRHSPFRGIFSAADMSKPETLIGYMSFGPIMYAFAKFISQKIEELKQDGKNPKVFFLLRDAHLLAKSCEAFAGKPLGKPIRIRKFVAVAASFRTREDVDFYIAGIFPEHYNFHVICEQLLLPKEIANEIIQLAYASPNPEKTFTDTIHRDDILQVILNNSKAYRERLKRYMHKEMQLEKGDTVVLIDVGYIGVTQKHLARILEEEQINLQGLYVIGSHEPDRPPSQSLFTTTACDHGLFEQSCTFKEGAVIDYDEQGNPIFDKIKLSDEQYQKVNAIQEECVRFIRDVKQFFDTAKLALPYSILQEAAFAALRRHVYFPVKEEIEYYQSFQHDKDMGPDLSKTMFNIHRGLMSSRMQPTASHLHPYETRVAHLEMTLSNLVQKNLNIELMPQDMSFTQENIKIMIVRGDAQAEMMLVASPTRDGYYTLFIPLTSKLQIQVLFGLQYQWLQIESLNIVGNQMQQGNDLQKMFSLHGMVNRGGSLYECSSMQSHLALSPPEKGQIQGYQIIFRPITKRSINA